MKSPRLSVADMSRLVGLFLVLLLVPVYPLAAQEPSAAEAEKTAPPVETETAQPVTIEEACRTLEGAATENGIPVEFLLGLSGKKAVSTLKPSAQRVP